MYDFFIAHAGSDIDKAEALHEILNKEYHVFLDKKSLKAGDNWSKVLPDALENSKVIVLLLSKASGNAYYLQEEISRAIQLQRTNKNWYRIVPIYLDGFPDNISEIPYGLYQLHSLDFFQEITNENICKKLIKYLLEVPGTSQESIKLKEKLFFKHTLHEFPEGPMVDGYLVSTTIIEAFAEFIATANCLQIINEANAFRREADPNEAGAITIRIINLPPPAYNSAKEFWLAAFVQARLHGPRMLAALLLSVQDTFFSQEVKREKYALLEKLKKIT